MSAQASKRYLLGEYRLEPDKRLLIRNGKTIKLAQRPFQVLLYLMGHRDQLVSRVELLDRFWDGKDVYDETLTKCVGAIRKALDDHSDTPRFIETRYGEGYRYVGPIEEQPVENNHPIVEVERTRALRVIVEEEEFQDEGSASESAIALSTRAASLSSVPAKFSRQTLGVMLACAILTLTALALIVYRSRAISVSAPPLQWRSVAVLPLKNLTGNPENEYLSDGLTESLISSLSRIPGLKVISRSSVFTFKGKE